MTENQPNQRELGFYLALAQVGMEMVSPLAIGIFLDYQFGWKPWATVIGFVFGFVGGFLHLLVLLKQHEQRETAEASRRRVAVSKNVKLLVAGTLLFWAVVAYPARVWWGESALLFSATAMALCLVPAVATLAWASSGGRKDAQQQLVIVFGGMSLRMVVVLGVGMVLYHNVPEFYQQRFWIWVIVFYLFTLTLEMVLLSRQLAAEQAAKK